MEIKGFLEEKIKNGNVVLFLGAGVGQAVGLKSTKELSNLLYSKANNPTIYQSYKDNFDQLVARFDKDPQFQRQWTNEKLCDYFINKDNYTNLDLIQRMLSYKWQAIFTTNYDMSVEYAFEQIRGKSPQRLITVVDPNELKIIQDRDSGKLKYFKIHGCVHEMDNNPSRAQRFIITTKDFSESSFRNKNLLQEFVSLAYNVPIIFLGFNIHKNSMLLESIYEVHKYLSDSTQQQFSNFYVALNDLTEDTRFELEDLEINILNGGVNEFIDELDRIHRSDNLQESQDAIDVETESINITYLSDNNQTLTIPKSEYDKNCEQFIAYHDSYFADKKSEFQLLNRQEIVDAWKSQPSDRFIFSDRCIKRTQHQEIFTEIKNQILNIRNERNFDASVIKKEPKNKLIFWGERGAGKSVLIRQVCKQVYQELGSPVLYLREDAMYVENNNGEDLMLSGWNGKIFDKFLSHFSRSAEGQSVVPIIVADHLPHMLYSIKNLYKHLLNHGKELVLILILNESDYLKEKTDNATTDEADKEYGAYKAVKIKHLLDDIEINDLFNSVKNDNLRINEFKPQLIEKAKDLDFGKKDLLFILYMWFDENFRRLEDIILEEARKINADEDFKKLYLAIAVFQQYNLEPRIDLCAIALSISAKSFAELKSNPLFQSLIKLKKHDYYFESYALTRHANFTRKLLNEVLPGSNDEKLKEQVSVIYKVLREIRPIDLDFVRLLFNNLYEARIYNPADIIKLKEASEVTDFFKKDFILNHQFAAYLIRENAKEHFTRVSYYLDVALESAPELSRSAIMHSKGHLEFKYYSNTGDIVHFQKAKDYFERVRATSNIPDEPDYVTEIDMITERINREKDQKLKSMLKVERTALINEGISVVAPERQNYIINRQEFATPFEQLNKDDRRNITDIIKSGKAPHTILKYYLDSKIANKNSYSWQKIKEVIDLYYNDKSPLATLVILNNYTKVCFIVNAEKRFEFQRRYFDAVVKDKENNLNFSLVAEYQRIMLIDAFVLGKYDFIKSALDDYRSTYRNSFPSFQKDEYIMPSNYYSFQNDVEGQIGKYINKSEDFYSFKKAQRFEKLVYLEHNRTDNYFHITMDQYSKFYVRGLRRELQGESQSRFSLDFCLRFGRDGFRAADIRRV